MRLQDRYEDIKQNIKWYGSLAIVQGLLTALLTMLAFIVPVFKVAWLVLLGINGVLEIAVLWHLGSLETRLDLVVKHMVREASK